MDETLAMIRHVTEMERKVRFGKLIGWIRLMDWERSRQEWGRLWERVKVQRG